VARVESPTLTAEAIVTAWVELPDAYAFRPEGNRLAGVARVLLPGGEKLRGPCLAFVVRHPDAGTILIDTGVHPDTIANLRADFGVRMGLVFRGMRPEGPFDEQLRERGVDPDAVEHVVMTHLHVDHTGAMRLLPNAEFTCARAEWEAATGTGAGGKGYVGHHLPPEERMRLVDFDDDATPHGEFARTIDLLGDGSIRLVSTPGHSAGHMSVLLQLGDGRELLVVGDAAYTLRSIDEQRLPLLTDRDSAYRESLRELKAYAEANPDAVLIPTHDPDAWRALA
jgi:N-acyl homoserine lactone hydrolase